MAIKHNILHRDGTKKVYESPAIAGQYIYFTNKGDDIINKKVGAGESFFIDNSESLSEKSINVQFLEDIQLKDAYIFWENAVWGDTVSIEVELSANTLFRSITDSGNVNVVDGVPTAITSSQIPDDTWTGSHIYFPIDVSLIRFVNEFPLNGTNNIGTVLESKGVALLSKELRLKMVLKSTSANPNLKVAVTAELYRENTL